MARQSPVAVAGFNLAVAGLPSFCQPSPRCCPRRRSCSPQNLKCFASNPQNLFGGRLRQRQNTSINQTLFAVCKYGGKASRFTDLNSERSNELRTPSNRQSIKWIICKCQCYPRQIPFRSIIVNLGGRAAGERACATTPNRG